MSLKCGTTCRIVILFYLGHITREDVLSLENLEFNETLEKRQAKERSPIRCLDQIN